MKIKNLCIVLLISLSLLSCSNSTNPSTSNSQNIDNNNKPATLLPLSFDLKGATAIASLSLNAVQNPSDPEKNVALYKVLEDYSIAPALSVNKNINLEKILKIIPTESNGQKFLYILFNKYSSYSQGTNTLYISPLLCVAEDGSCSEVLTYNSSNPINVDTFPTIEMVTDNLGNLYFAANINVSTGIFKYNPITKELTKLSLFTDKTIYRKIQVSNDGKKLFVAGDRLLDDNSSEYFWRCIPTDTPNDYVDIKYSSSNFIPYNWTYDNKTDSLFFISNSFDKDSTLNLYQIPNTNNISTTKNKPISITKLNKATMLENQQLYTVLSYMLGGKMYATDAGLFTIPQAGTTTFYPPVLFSKKADSISYKTLAGYYTQSVIQKDNYLVFKNSILNSDNTESGKSNLVMFDGKTSKLIKLGSNFNESLNIQSFSISDEKVFFTAEKGTSLVSGAIDLATNIYKPIKTEDTFSLIAAY